METALSVSSAHGWEGHSALLLAGRVNGNAAPVPIVQPWITLRFRAQRLGTWTGGIPWSLLVLTAVLTSMEMQMICKHNNHFLIKTPHLSILQEIPLLKGAEADLIPLFAKVLTR